MANDARMLQVEVVTRTERLWHGLASSVIVPSIDGDLGILVNRAPILAVLRPGTVVLDTADEGNREIEVSAGFASVDSNFVTIVVDSGDFTRQ